MERAGASERKTGWGEGARGRGRELSVCPSLCPHIFPSVHGYLPPSLTPSIPKERG